MILLDLIKETEEKARKIRVASRELEEVLSRLNVVINRMGDNNEDKRSIQE